MIKVTHRVKNPAWRPLLAGQRPGLQRLLVLTTMAKENLPPRLTVDILWTNNAEIQQLNTQWRGKDKPTNILSFPAGYLENPPDFLSEIPLGDLVLAYETIAAEAQTLGILPLAHIQHLVVHGTLHLLGFTHDGDTDTEIMHNWEIEILSQAGAPNPYLPYLNDE